MKNIVMNNFAFCENFFVVVLGLYLLYIAFYLIDKAAFGGKYFKRLPKPYFEGYVIETYYLDFLSDFYFSDGYFCRIEDGQPIFMMNYPRRFYTKYGAKLFARKINHPNHPCFVARKRWFM